MRPPWFSKYATLFNLDRAHQRSIRIVDLPHIDTVLAHLSQQPDSPIRSGYLSGCMASHGRPGSASYSTALLDQSTIANVSMTSPDRDRRRRGSDDAVNQALQSVMLRRPAANVPSASIRPGVRRVPSSGMGMVNCITSSGTRSLVVNSWMRLRSAIQRVSPIHPTPEAAPEMSPGPCPARPISRRNRPSSEKTLTAGTSGERPSRHRGKRQVRSPAQHEPGHAGPNPALPWTLDPEVPLAGRVRPVWTGDSDPECVFTGIEVGNVHSECHRLSRRGCSLRP